MGWLDKKLSIYKLNQIFQFFKNSTQPKSKKKT